MAIGYLGFLIFVILTTKSQKHLFCFWMNKNDNKIQNFEHFQKPYNMQLANAHHRHKFQLTHRFLTSKKLNLFLHTPNGDVICIVNRDVLGVLDHVQKYKWHHWIPGGILHQKQVYVFSKLNISKFGIGNRWVVGVRSYPSPLVGSSRSRTRGEWSSAFAISTRLCKPPIRFQHVPLPYRRPQNVQAAPKFGDAGFYQRVRRDVRGV